MSFMYSKLFGTSYLTSISLMIVYFVYLYFLHIFLQYFSLVSIYLFHLAMLFVSIDPEKLLFPFYLFATRPHGLCTCIYFKTHIHFELRLSHLQEKESHDFAIRYRIGRRIAHYIYIYRFVLVTNFCSLRLLLCYIV